MSTLKFGKRNCPDETTLAAIAFGLPDHEFLSSWESHISDCENCLERIADLSRIQSMTEETVPGAVLARASKLGTANLPQFKPARWATAAVLVMTVGLVWMNLDQQVTPPTPALPSGSPAMDDRQVRNVDVNEARPEILMPAAGSVISSSPRFEWTTIPNSLYYDIRIVTAVGEPMTQARVTETNWVLPPNIELKPGSEYFVRVDAYVAEGKRLSSRHVVFTTVDKP